MQTIIIITTIVILVLTSIVAIKNRRDVMRFLVSLSIGIIIADTVMLALLFYSSYKETGVSLGLASFFTALQIGTLNADFSGIFSEIGKYQSITLHILFYILFILTPLCFASFVASLFRSFCGALKYFLLSPNSNIYFFSNLNEESYNLAKDISKPKNDKNALLVFCGIPSTDKNELISNALKAGFIVTKKSMEEFISRATKNRYYFAISENHSANLRMTQTIIDAYTENKKIKSYENVRIYLRCDLAEAELLMDARDEKQISVIFINEAATASNELLFKYPLYSVLKEDQNEISVLLLGAGNTGDKILKLICSVMQMGEKYSAKIMVADKDAKKYKSKLGNEAPELLLDEYNLSFEDVDVESSDFEQFLDAKCPDVNYAVVCLGDDDRSLRAALHLRMHYLRKNPSAAKTPFIGVQIKDSEKNHKIPMLKAKNQDYNLATFGGNDSIFSYELFVNSELDKIAINIHKVYQGDYGKNMSYADILKSFNSSEDDRRSNRVCAVHIIYKLFVLGYGIKRVGRTGELTGEEKSETENSELLIKELCKKLEDESVLDELAKIEHDRWNARERSDGWQSVSIEEAKKYQSITNSHKNVIAKLHPCICPWEMLDTLSQAYNGKDFKAYDRRIVKYIPEILGLTKETSSNVSGVEYMLVRR